MNTIDELAATWRKAKLDEARSVEVRRQTEDAIAALLRIPENLDGPKNADTDAFKIKVVGRLNKKVDADLIQEIAAEIGCEDHLQTMFRWKPEINAANWKGAPQYITEALSRAITTTPARPSFDIVRKEV